MGSTQPNPTQPDPCGLGWVGLGWTYVMGWVGLNFLLIHHGGLGQKIDSTRSMHTPTNKISSNIMFYFFIFFFLLKTKGIGMREIIVYSWIIINTYSLLNLFKWVSLEPTIYVGERKWANWLEKQRPIWTSWASWPYAINYSAKKRKTKTSILQWTCISIFIFLNR